jgi:hypothetical protein
MVPPSQPFSGTDAKCEGRKGCKSDEHVEKVKHRQLLQEFEEHVSDDRVRELWGMQVIRVKDA